MSSVFARYFASRCMLTHESSRDVAALCEQAAPDIAVRLHVARGRRLPVAARIPGGEAWIVHDHQHDGFALGVALAVEPEACDARLGVGLHRLVQASTLVSVSVCTLSGATMNQRWV